MLTASPRPAPVPAPRLEPDGWTLPVAAVNIFDEAALYRATRSIATAEPWSAFIPHPRPAPERKQAPLAPWLEPVHATTPPLQQRVPGTSLPVPSAAAPTTAPPPAADAEAARALVDDFESGVQRAQRQADTAASLGTVPTAPAAGAHRNGVPHDDGGNGGNGGRAPLIRRQPGMTLDALQDGGRPSSPSTTSPANADPQQVRDLVNQFEAGVTRALHDARTDQEHGRGSQL
jgi:hypothetical protein